MKARIHEEARHEVRGDRLAVDGGDEHALVAAVRAFASWPARAQEMRQPRGRLRALRFLGGQKDQHVWIAAPQPRHQLAVAQNHFSIGRARQNARRRLRVFFGHRQIGPAQDRTIGVGRIGRGQLHELRLLQRWLGAQLAQQIHGCRQRELRCAQAGDKVSAADAAALFESLQHVVDCAESARHIFRRNRFAQQHAVAIEQLQRQCVAALGRVGRREAVTAGS